MATILQPDMNQDDEQKKQQAQSLDGSGAAPQQMSSGEGGTTASSQPAGTSSGRFTNIQKYLQANKDYNAQGGGLAGKIASNINDQGQQVQGQLGQAQQDFQTQADSNRVKYNGDMVNQALADPTKFVQDQNNMSQFQNMRDAQYKGPKSLDDLNNAGQIMNNANNVQTMASETGDQNGRYQLLGQMFNRPSYSTGQRRLDNLLLQANPQQQQVLGSTQQTAQQVGNALDQTKQSLGALGSQYQQEAADTANQVKSALGDQDKETGAFGNFFQGLDQRVGDAANAAGTLKNDVLNMQLTDKDMQALGDPSLVGKQVYFDPDQSISSVLNPLYSAPTRGSVASSDDLAKYQALAQLAGVSGSKLTNAQQIPQQGIIDKNAFANLINSSGQRLNDAMAKVHGQYDQAEQTFNDRTNLANQFNALNQQYQQAGSANADLLNQLKQLAQNASTSTYGGTKDWASVLNQLSNDSTLTGGLRGANVNNDAFKNYLNNFTSAAQNGVNEYAPQHAAFQQALQDIANRTKTFGQKDPNLTFGSTPLKGKGPVT